MQRTSPALVHYFTFRPWPKDAFTDSQVGVTWNHLWYLAYAWTYSLVVIAAMPLLRSRVGRFVRQRVAGLRGRW